MSAWALWAWAAAGALPGAVPAPAAGDARIPFEIAASTDAPVLGERVGLRLRLRPPAGMSLALDAPASSTDTYRVTAASEEAAGEAGVRIFRAEVLPLVTGRVPVVAVFSASGPGFSGELRSPAVLLTVAEPPIDPQGAPRDIKAPRDARAALWPWLLAALAAAAAAWRLSRRGRSDARQADAPPPDARPPHVRAAAELDELAASGLWEQARYKEFYIRLTDILRTFLEGRHGFGATRMTTAELLRMMRQLEAEREAAALLRGILERSDLVKFARIRPEPGQGPEEIAQARAFVGLQRPAASTGVEAAAGGHAP